MFLKVCERIAISALSSAIGKNVFILQIYFDILQKELNIYFVKVKFPNNLIVQVRKGL